MVKLYLEQLEPRDMCDAAPSNPAAGILLLSPESFVPTIGNITHAFAQALINGSNAFMQAVTPLAVSVAAADPAKNLQLAILGGQVQFATQLLSAVDTFFFNFTQNPADVQGLTQLGTVGQFLDALILPLIGVSPPPATP